MYMYASESALALGLLLRRGPLSSGLFECLPADGIILVCLRSDTVVPGDRNHGF
jgi:hypothetical protein